MPNIPLPVDYKALVLAVYPAAVEKHNGMGPYYILHQGNELGRGATRADAWQNAFRESV